MTLMDTTQQHSRIVSIGFVVLLHILIGYAFITGLAYNVVKTVSEELKTFDVIEPAAPAETPPAEPQESVEPAPVVAPKSVVPSKVKTNAAMPSSSSPRASTGSMSARWRRGSFDNDRDYPPAALRREEQGTVRVGFTIGTNGRVTSCNVLQSSGSSTLDSTTCRIILSRFRYEPARDSFGNPVAETRTQPVTWRIS
jgi:periplasmic protein TonB